jgi:hypothetical protein
MDSGAFSVAPGLGLLLGECFPVFLFVHDVVSKRIELEIGGVHVIEVQDTDQEKRRFVGLL